MPSAEFEKAASDVQNLNNKPDNDTLLKLYGLFKQASFGDNTTAKPGVFDLKGKYKWEAWEALKGKSQEEAEKEYIALVEELKSKD